MNLCMKDLLKKQENDNLMILIVKKWGIEYLKLLKLVQLERMMGKWWLKFKQS